MAPYVGEIRLFSFAQAPKGWFPCDGRKLPIAEHRALFQVLTGVCATDNRTWFALPDLSGRVPIGHGSLSPVKSYPMGSHGGSETHTLTVLECPEHGHVPVVSAGEAISATPGPDRLPGFVIPSTQVLYAPADTAGKGSQMAPTGTIGSGAAHDNMMPSVVMNYCIADQGAYPPDGDPTGETIDGYLGEIRIVAFWFGADGFLSDADWLPCDGRLLPIDGNGALYGLIGTTYGGDGIGTFALPALDGDPTGSVVISQGEGAGLSPRTIGQAFGSMTSTLSPAHLPVHAHPFALRDSTEGTSWPGESGFTVMIDPKTNGFSTATPNVTLAPDMVGLCGGGGTHANDQPTLGLCYAIAIYGDYPVFA